MKKPDKKTCRILGASNLTVGAGLTIFAFLKEETIQSYFFWFGLIWIVMGITWIYRGRKCANVF